MTGATIRSNEDAAEEIAEGMRRRFGWDLRQTKAGMKWLAACIGEVRAEVVDQSLPTYHVARRWSRDQTHD